jgi:hypothetical protein
VFDLKDLARQFPTVIFHFINRFATRIVARRRVAFRVFVGQTRTHSPHYIFACYVFTCNQIYFLPLPLVFLFNQIINFAHTNLLCLIENSLQHIKQYCNQNNHKRVKVGAARAPCPRIIRFRQNLRLFAFIKIVIHILFYE